jgi:hypothetical protein
VLVSINSTTQSLPTSALISLVNSCLQLLSSFTRAAQSSLLSVKGFIALRALYFSLYSFTVAALRLVFSFSKAALLAAFSYFISYL